MNIADPWDRLQTVAQKVLEHWHSAAVVCLVGVAMIYAFYLNTENTRLEVRKKRKAERDSGRDNYLAELNRRMEALELQAKEETQTRNAVFREEFYFGNLQDERESIREVLRRRSKKTL